MPAYPIIVTRPLDASGRRLPRVANLTQTVAGSQAAASDFRTFFSRAGADDPGKTLNGSWETDLADVFPQWPGHRQRPWRERNSLFIGSWAWLPSCILAAGRFLGAAARRKNHPPGVRASVANLPRRPAATRNRLGVRRWGIARVCVADLRELTVRQDTASRAVAARSQLETRISPRSPQWLEL